MVAAVGDHGLLGYCAARNSRDFANLIAEAGHPPFFLKMSKRCCTAAKRGHSAKEGLAVDNIPSSMQRWTARVIGPSSMASHLELLLGPGVGMLDGGVQVHIPAELVPAELRVPDTLLVVAIHHGHPAGFEVLGRAEAQAVATAAYSS